MIFDDITKTCGRTPLVHLARLGKDVSAKILGKIEYRNPTGSVKDRIAVAMVDEAERSGRLKRGGTIVEATSGNTGIGLGFVCAARGYRLVLTMPEAMSKERRALLAFLGADVVLTRGALMRDAVQRATELLDEIPGAVSLDQFKNPANPEIHRQTTGPEIWDDTEGKVDYFVAGVGTGGTITGVGEVLKKKKSAVRIVAVEPAKCAVLSGQRPGNHVIQGIGAGFVPAILNRSVIDEIIPVSDEDAFVYARKLARDEGILSGISSGAAVAAALAIARRPEAARKVIVVALPDGGERYVTTPLVSELVKRS
jgi:cysteine synthase A